MQGRFLGKMRTMSDEKLMDILRRSDEYQGEAVDSAFIVVVERGIKDEVFSRIKSEVHGQATSGSSIMEGRPYTAYNPVNVIALHPGTPEQTDFEAALLDNDISYFRQDTGRPVIKYYFSDEDMERVHYLLHSVRANIARMPKGALQRFDDWMGQWFGRICLVCLSIAMAFIVLKVCMVI